jgi:hypothetical protein
LEIIDPKNEPLATPKYPVVKQDRLPDCRHHRICYGGNLTPVTGSLHLFRGSCLPSLCLLPHIFLKHSKS